MMFDKLTGNEFAKDKNFMDHLIAATEKLFKSHLTVQLFVHKDHIIKGYAYTDKSGQHYMYLIENKGGLFSVYREDVASYQIKNGLPSIKSLFNTDIAHWQKATVQGEDVKIYLPSVFKETSQNFSTNISSEQVEKMLKLPDLDSNLKELLLYTQKLYAEPKEKGLSATSSIGYMKQYVNMLDKLDFMQSASHEFYVKKSTAFTLSLASLQTDIINRYKYLKEQCIVQGFKDKESAFFFNDYDNSVWVKENRLYLASQNTCFECVEEKGVVKCYLLNIMNHSMEDELKRIEQKRATNQIDMFSDTTLIFDKDSILYADNALMECIWCDFKYSSVAFEGEGFGHVQYPIDIKSFSYQQQFMFDQYGKSKLDFLIYNFLSLEATDYDPVNKCLWNDSVFYKEIKKFDSPENDNKVKTKQVFYTLRKDIEELNDEWKEGLAFLLKCLKSKQYIPELFHYHEKLSKEYPEKSLDVIIESIEEWFDKYGSSPVKKLKM